MASSDLSSTENLSAAEAQASTEAQASVAASDELSAQMPQPSLEGSMLESRTFAPKKSATLVQRLLTVVLPTALVPLVVAGAVEFRTVKQKATEQAVADLVLESTLAADVADIYLQDTLKIPEVITLEPKVQKALKTSAAAAIKQGLPTKPIDAVEKQFSATKLLQPNAELNQFLQNVAEVEGFEEIFFTERHGFNEGFSRPTSDFVQRDEEWWQVASQKGRYVGIADFDESTGLSNGLELAQAIKDTKTGDFLGVIKSLTSTETLSSELELLLKPLLKENQAIEILDARAGAPVTVILSEDAEEDLVGKLNAIAGVKEIARELDRAVLEPDTPADEVAQNIRIAVEMPDLDIQITPLILPTGEQAFTALFILEDRQLSMTTIPNTKWVSLAAIDISLINAAGNNLIRTFALTTALLAVAATVVLTLLARRLAAPLEDLTGVAEAATAGNLNARAKLAGTVETQTLGQGFNALLGQTQTLLQEQSENAAEQLRQRQALEDEIADLMEDVGDAAEGDLRVRAKLSDGDVGIVADLFNSIIENLRITTRQVKSSTGQVNSSLVENEATVLDLSAQAVEEAESLRDTMEAVEDIAKSIDEVATNASEASALTKDTYATVQAGTQSMDQTVTSILGLRSTVGETAKKIKRLGESAQKISQAVSLIDEIALKTNLLAVNASVEAARAGEMGQGFTAVAEQVGSLAEQSAAATQEIAKIVSGIQTETQEVVEAIETGTAQVVDSTSLVEATKQQLAEVLLKSEQINQLMARISASAQYQTESSAAVTDLVKDAAESSAQRSQSSQAMAKSIQETAQVAKALEASVEQFKLED